MEQWIAILVAAIQAGQEAGEFVLTASPIEAARRLAALCLGLDVMVGLELPAHSETDVQEMG